MFTYPSGGKDVAVNIYDSDFAAAAGLADYVAQVRLGCSCARTGWLAGATQLCAAATAHARWAGDELLLTLRGRLRGRPAEVAAAAARASQLTSAFLNSCPLPPALQASAEAFAARGAFTIALSGGSLVKSLAGLVGRSDVDFSKW